MRDKEKERQYRARWYQENKEEILARERVRYHRYYKNKPGHKEKKNTYNKTYRLLNKELIREKKLIKNYGLTIEAYDVMKHNQNGLCAICKKDKTLVVDHCHATGHIRSLVCNQCNQILGLAYENKETLKAAIDYLSKHEP